MKKILFISPRYDGGIGGHANRLALKLKANNYDVEILKIPHLPIKNLKNISFVIFGITKAIFLRKKYDIVHAFNLPSAFPMYFINSDKKILAIHGAYAEQIGSIHSKKFFKIANFLESIVIKWPEIITTDSNFIKKYYENKYSVKINCIYAPLEFDRLKKIIVPEIKKNQILFLGRDSYEKGIDILKKIESRINSHVVYCTNVTWETAMEMLSKSRILVVPSRMESIPQVIKEAFYFRVPVVATNVGGIGEIITHSKTGIIVEPDNHEQLLNSINELINDEELQKCISENAYKELIMKFSWDKLFEEYLKLYDFSN